MEFHRQYKCEQSSHTQTEYQLKINVCACNVVLQHGQTSTKCNGHCHSHKKLNHSLSARGVVFSVWWYISLCEHRSMFFPIHPFHFNEICDLICEMHSNCWYKKSLSTLGPWGFHKIARRSFVIFSLYVSNIIRLYMYKYCAKQTHSDSKNVKITAK